MSPEYQQLWLMWTGVTTSVIVRHSQTTPRRKTAARKEDGARLQHAVYAIAVLTGPAAECWVQGPPRFPGGGQDL